MYQMQARLHPMLFTGGENLVQLLDIGNPLGLRDRPEFFLHQLRAGQHLVGREIVIQGQRRTVLNAFLDRVLVQIALLIRGAEGLERPLP